jgi:hypothetical protein
MFGGMAYKIGVLAKKATGGGGGDVTPNTMVFGDTLGPSPTDSNLVTVTGINTTISLTVNSSFEEFGSFYYILNGGPEVNTQIQSTFSVQNNDTLKFRFYTGLGGGVSYQVLNNSDGGATVGTGSIYID